MTERILIDNNSPIAGLVPESSSQVPSQRAQRQHWAPAVGDIHATCPGSHAQQHAQVCGATRCLRPELCATRAALMPPELHELLCGLRHESKQRQRRLLLFWGAQLLCGGGQLCKERISRALMSSNANVFQLVKLHYFLLDCIETQLYLTNIYIYT